MKRLPLVVILLARVAMADTVTSVAVSDSTPTRMPSSMSTTRRSVMVENHGANSIYCSPSSTVTTDTGFEVASGAWRSFPGAPVWCIAATGAQTGTGSDRTLVWESDS